MRGAECAVASRGETERARMEIYDVASARDNELDSPLLGAPRTPRRRGSSALRRRDDTNFTGACYYDG